MIFQYDLSAETVDHTAAIFNSLASAGYSIVSVIQKASGIEITFNGTEPSVAEIQPIVTKAMQ